LPFVGDKPQRYILHCFLHRFADILLTAFSRCEAANLRSEPVEEPITVAQQPSLAVA